MENVKWEFCLSFEASAFSEGVEHKVTGTLPACVARILEHLEAGNPAGAFLSWPTGSGVGGLYVGPSETLLEALEIAWHELEGVDGPPAIFDDPAEEDAARAHVPALLRALGSAT